MLKSKLVKKDLSLQSLRLINSKMINKADTIMKKASKIEYLAKQTEINCSLLNNTNETD